MSAKVASCLFILQLLHVVRFSHTAQSLSTPETTSGYFLDRECGKMAGGSRTDIFGRSGP